MAHYTITIKSLIKNGFDFQMTSYPIYDETYRETLNNNILNHYYMNEIGFETPALFRFYLNQKLNEIMPYYNKLYQAQLDALKNYKVNTDYTETSNGTSTSKNNASSESEDNGTSKSTGTNKTTSNSKNVYLDTPQGDLYKGSIDDTNYATNVTFNTDSEDTSNTNDGTTTNKSNSSSSSEDNATNENIRKVLGNTGGKYPLDLLNDLKNNLMNIDMMIIKDLDDLFMGIY